MTEFKALCVYCGSRVGASPAFESAAEAFGRGMGERGINLVYGGGRVGLMGVLADAVKAAGAHVTGVIPRHLLAKEAGPGAVDKLEIVDSMHERKARMAELAGGFVILPGGLGTLDEFFEILTWKQLALHDLPILVIDVDGYWTPLTELIEHIVERGFADELDADMIHVVGTVEDAFEALEQLSPALIKVASDRL